MSLLVCLNPSAFSIFSACTCWCRTWCLWNFISDVLGAVNCFDWWSWEMKRENNSDSKYGTKNFFKGKACPRGIAIETCQGMIWGNGLVKWPYAIALQSLTKPTKFGKFHQTCRPFVVLNLFSFLCLVPLVEIKRFIMRKLFWAFVELQVIGWAKFHLVCWFTAFYKQSCNNAMTESCFSLF